MLDDVARARVARQVKHFTDAYRTSKEAGYNVRAMALPTFDSQGDFDGCRPAEGGTDFRHHNEFIAEVLTGLLANAVAAEPVLFRYSEFSGWLKGKPITPENGSAYGAYLLAEGDRKKKSTRQE
jgi:hypothetical protein